MLIPNLMLWIAASHATLNVIKVSGTHLYTMIYPITVFLNQWYVIPCPVMLIGLLVIYH